MLIKMEKEAKIYISGHTGMVGKTLHTKLLKHGYKNIITKTSTHLDLRNQNEVSKFFKKEKPEYVFHIAARVGGIGSNIKYPAEFLYDNIMINANIINAAHIFKAKKLIYLGSSCIYPKECPQPMKEEYLLSGKLEPTNEGYALAKITGLKLCEYYCREYGCNFISIMVPNLYGINEKFNIESSHVIASLILKFHKAKLNKKKKVIVWGTGNARREFLYVKDLADAVICFMQKYDANHTMQIPGFINVGTGKDISIKELAYLIKDAVNFKGDIIFDQSKPDGMPQKLLDTAKSNNIGWKPKTSLVEGLRKTYDWFLENYKDGY